MAENNPIKHYGSTFAWLWFAGIGILFVVLGIYSFALQSLQPDHWLWMTTSTTITDYVGSTFRWLGMISFGFGFFTLAIAYNSFRKGEKWAWYAFTLYPLFFTIAIPVTWPGLLWLPFVVASVTVLWLTRRSFFESHL